MSAARHRPDLVVHMGLGAAATLLTSALSLLEAELARQGVRTARANAVPPVGGAPLLVTAPAPPAPSDPSDGWEFCSLQRDEVAAVIERSGARRVRILFSPERQDRLLERSYRNAVAEGFAGTLAERFPRAQQPLLDYRPLVSELLALPGVLDLRMVPLELVAAGQVAYVDALLAALDCEQPVGLGPLARWRVPREYGLRGLRIALAMAPHLDTDAERAAVRKYVLATFSMPVGASPQVMTASERAQVLAAYRPANLELFATHGPEYPETAYNGRGGLHALGAVLSPVTVRVPPRPPVESSSGLRRVAGLRTLAGRVRRRLRR